MLKIVNHIDTRRFLTKKIRKILGHDGSDLSTSFFSHPPALNFAIHGPPTVSKKIKSPDKKD